MMFKDKKLAFLGDSITDGAVAGKPEFIYHALLGKLFDAREVINYGISGTRIAIQTVPSLNPVEDKYFASRVDEMDDDCDFVFVFGGTNDFGHGDAEFGCIDDCEDNTFCGCCRQLFEKLISKYGHEKLIVLLPLHRVGEENPYGDGSKKIPNRQLADYVGVIRKLAENFGLKTVDLWNEKELNPNIKEYENNFFDGLHPNRIGHRILAEKIWKACQ